MTITHDYLELLVGSNPICDNVGLEEWLSLAVARKTHPLCLVFAQHYRHAFDPALVDHFSGLTLSQLSRLSEDLLFLETSAMSGKRRVVTKLVHSRLGEAGGALFMDMYEDIQQHVLPEVWHIANGRPEALTSSFRDALITCNEDMDAARGGTLSSLLTPAQAEQAEKNTLWVLAYAEYLPRTLVDAFKHLPKHPVVVQRSQQADPDKLAVYGKNLVARFLHGVFLLPENWHFPLVKKFFDLTSTREAMAAMRAFTGQPHLLANVPACMLLSMLEGQTQPARIDLYEEVCRLLTGQESSNALR